MLRSGPTGVNSSRAWPASGAGRDLPAAPGALQTAGPSPHAGIVDVLIYPAIAAAALLGIAATGLLLRRRGGRRKRAVAALLDAADGLEDRLRTARSEIEAIAGEHGEDPVRDAMREMLRQRLWLREHGDQASVEDLERVRASIDDARVRIERQLARVDEARAPPP